MPAVIFMSELIRLFQIVFTNAMGKFDLDVTTLQLSVLYCWNDRPREQLSYECLHTATQLPTTELTRTLYVSFSILFFLVGVLGTVTIFKAFYCVLCLYAKEQRIVSPLCSFVRAHLFFLAVESIWTGFVGRFSEFGSFIFVLKYSPVG